MRVERVKKLYFFGSVPNAHSRIESYVQRLTDFSALQAPSCRVLLRITHDVTTLRSVPQTTSGNVNKNTAFTQQYYLPKQIYCQFSFGFNLFIILLYIICLFILFVQYYQFITIFVVIRCLFI